MDGSNSHHQGYWFVLREDQDNVIFSSNNLSTIQNPHIPTDQEPPRYIIETANRHYQPISTVTEVPAPQVKSEAIAQDPIPAQQKIKDEFWDLKKVRLLLTLCLENKDGSIETSWDNISSVIGTNPEECSNKYRHLRRTYLRLLKKKRMGKDIKWAYYKICEDVFTDLQALPPSALEPWEDEKTRRLLSLYIENLPKFRNPNNLQKDLWKEIAAQLDSTGYNCYHKFKNLKKSYLNWMTRSRQTGKALKYEYQEYFEQIYYNFNPNKRAWDRYKIKNLLEAYAEIAHKFKNPKLQKKELWNEISRKVGESPSACDKKFRNLKQTYMRLKMKVNSGRLTTKWRYFRDFELIYSPQYIVEDGTHNICRSTQEENYIKHLLEFYLANKEKFKDPLTRNRSLWRLIAVKLGMTPEECDKKFRNLKQTYIRLAWKKKQTGMSSKWPYFSYFEKIYDNDTNTTNSDEKRRELDETVKAEVRRALKEFHKRNDSDMRFETLTRLAQESNEIQRERNRILLALINRK